MNEVDRWAREYLRGLAVAYDSVTVADLNLAASGINSLTEEQAAELARSIGVYAMGILLDAIEGRILQGASLRAALDQFFADHPLPD